MTGPSSRKRLEGFACAALALPLFVMLRLHTWLLGRERAFHLTSQAAALVPDGVGTLLRRGFYQGALTRCGGNASISFGTVLSKPAAEIGHHVYIGKYCCVGLVSFGDDVLVADHVDLLSGANQHGIEDLETSIREQGGRFDRIEIGDGAWVGSGSVVMASIGAHAVVAAGSVVTRPVPEYAIVGGNPAKMIRSRRDDGQN